MYPSCVPNGVEWNSVQGAVALVPIKLRILLQPDMEYPNNKCVITEFNNLTIKYGGLIYVDLWPAAFQISFRL